MLNGDTSEFSTKPRCWLMLTLYKSPLLRAEGYDSVASYRPILHLFLTPLLPTDRLMGGM